MRWAFDKALIRVCRRRRIDSDGAGGPPGRALAKGDQAGQEAYENLTSNQVITIKIIANYAINTRANSLFDQ
jgi:hypothetical protein